MKIFKKYIDKLIFILYNNSCVMVDVVQLVERQIVVLVVVGSSPIVHPI